MSRIKSEEDYLLEHVTSVEVKLRKLKIPYPKEEFDHIKSDIQDIIDKQYTTEVMIYNLRNELYPPQYIIQKIRFMNPRHDDFELLVDELRKACFKTSPMWKQSNMGIFDFLHEQTKK